MSQFRGRRPAGPGDSRRRAPDQIEKSAAGVLAFDVMECELARFGAPPDLRVRAQKARADEVGHAQRMSEIARRRRNAAGQACGVLAFNLL